MITFIEHHETGYPLRTRDNCLAADGTLVFTVDHKSPGEILTHKICYGASKPYYRVDISEYSTMQQREVDDLVKWFKDNNIHHLNIAGNSLPSAKCKYTQEGYDAKVAEVMDKVSAYHRVDTVRSGGQSGADEAGAKWADSQRIPCTVLAPKGWMFRLQYGKDICDQHLFIKRFGPAYDLSDII